MVLILFLMVSSLFALEADSLFSVGDCKVGAYEGNTRQLQLKAQEFCPAANFELDINESEFNDLLFSRNGPYAKFRGTQEAQWIWTDALFLFQRATQQSLNSSDSSQLKVKSLSQLENIINSLNEKYPLSWSALIFNFQSSQLTKCLSNYSPSIQIIRDSIDVKASHVYLDLEFDQSISQIYYSQGSEFNSLTNLSSNNNFLIDSIAYSQIQNDSVNLWLVDSCGLVHRSTLQLSWPWQPSFHQIKTQGMGQIESILLSSNDMLDSMVHWRSYQLRRGDQLVALDLPVLDSNTSQILFPLLEPLAGSGDLGLEFILNTQVAARKHPVIDGVAPIIESAHLEGDTLTVIFSESLRWNSGFQLKTKLQPLQTNAWTQGINTKLSFMLSPGSIKPGDSLSLQRVLDPSGNLSDSSNYVRVEGVIAPSSSELSASYIAPSHVMYSNQNSPGVLGSSKLTQFSSWDSLSLNMPSAGYIPIRLELPAQGEGQARWEIQLDIYDQSSQAVLNSTLSVKCEDLFEGQELCLDGTYEDLLLEIPWYGRTQGERLVGTGAYIARIKVYSNNQLLINGQHRFGIKIRD